MKYSLLFSLAIAPFFARAQECPALKPHQRDITILPDTAGEEALALFGHYAVNNFQTNQLEKLLLAQAAPILVEDTIWKRFIKKKKGQLSRFEQLPYAYYHVNSFLLAIPRIWQQQFPNTGFKLASLKPINKPFSLTPGILDPLKSYVKTMLTLVNVYSSLVTALRISMQSTGFNWNVLLFGHGGPGLGAYTARVAGIPFTEFKKLLRFLNTDISTNIFLYQTCYAGSPELLKSYITQNKPDTYSYPIILTGLSKAPVYSSTGTPLTVYRSFFQKIKSLSLCSQNIQDIGFVAGTLLEAITVHRQKNKLVLQRVNNIIQIRWPNSDHFISLPLDRLVSSAQTTLEKTTPEEAARITTSAFIIDKPIIQTPLHLTKKHHALISSLPIKTHYLSRIIMEKESASNSPFMQQLFSFFTPTQKLTASKLFLIDQVQNNATQKNAQNVMIFLNSSTPSTYPLQKKTELFYRMNNDGYRLKQGAKEVEKLSPHLMQKYMQRFETEKKKVTF